MPPGLPTIGPNREALRLYREILRTARRFYWPNDEGEPWREVLRREARKEFEQARAEKDPLIIARLLVVGRDCVMQTQYKFDMTQQKIKEKVDRTRTR
ncbi:hypothetical protein NSK_008294 [Nannochloropsis salina CCMP1776]|uniref:Complex 1 LYR protein domain-containing protein n=1 Tax=Nannochloropsis salina CCMP1776 TaxID=1027361 RepID=A0A4D9CQU1_9STRA|nr:hypothetical protein NSK_008294 [Nannochloropsis salina CCMP1776]|eukprot:TFJ80387.1 hypothetical protein NSK_008294 [Nannochloropsis salina CCMP1776]